MQKRADEEGLGIVLEIPVTLLETREKKRNPVIRKEKKVAASKRAEIPRQGEKHPKKEALWDMSKVSGASRKRRGKARGVKKKVCKQ